MSSLKPIKPPSARKKPFLQRKTAWLFILLLLAASGTGWYFLAGPGSSKAQSSASLIPESQSQTAVVRRGNIILSASGSGTLTAAESADLSFSASGTVTELSVSLGDTVQAGDVLARLGGSLTLEADLASAQLQLLEAQQSLEDLQKNAGLSLAQSYQDLITAQETYKSALETSQRTGYARCSQEVNIRYKAALDRTTEKLAALTQTEKGSDAWITARNDYDTALANYNYCISYTSDEKTSAQSQFAVAEAALKQAEETYATLKESSGIDLDELERLEATVKAAETQLANVQDELEGLVLTAPIGGKIVYLAAHEGEIVDTSLFITIADVSHPALIVSVDENDVPMMVVGSPVTVNFDALPDQEFNGILTQVDPQLVTSGQYQIVQGIVKLDSDAARTVQSLPLGMNASVTIISQQANDVLLVPLTALQLLESGEYILDVVDASGNLSQRSVTVGLMDTTRAEITGGLEEGETVSTVLTKYSIAGTGAANNSTDEMIMPEGGPPPDGGGVPMP